MQSIYETYVTIILRTISIINKCQNKSFGQGARIKESFQAYVSYFFLVSTGGNYNCRNHLPQKYFTLHIHHLLYKHCLLELSICAPVHTGLDMNDI